MFREDGWSSSTSSDEFDFESMDSDEEFSMESGSSVEKILEYTEDGWSSSEEFDFESIDSDEEFSMEPKARSSVEKILENTRLLFKLLQRTETLRDDSYIADLIESSCRVQTKNRWGETLLHLAVKSSSIENAEALIQCGADVNAEDYFRRTPLFVASEYNREEMIGMLLYYDANTKGIDHNGSTCLAVKLTSERTCRLFTNYFDEDDGVLIVFDMYYVHGSISRNSASAWLSRLINQGANVNMMDWRMNNPLTFSISDHNADLFKLIWSRIDHGILMKLSRPFLYLFREHCRFTPEEWSECFYLILKSPVARQLIKDMKRLCCFGNFFGMLLQSFAEMKIERSDRVNLIYILLSLDATINIWCVELVYRIYGFDKEMKAILDCGKLCNRGLCNQNIPNMYLMAHFLTTMKEDPDKDEIFGFLRNVAKGHYFDNIPNCDTRGQYIMRFLRLFSLPDYMRKELVSLISYDTKVDNTEIVENIQAMSGIPSLVELSRDQLRACIKRQVDIKKTHCFYEAVKRLPIPKKIREIICLKRPPE